MSIKRIQECIRTDDAQNDGAPNDMMADEMSESEEQGMTDFQLETMLKMIIELLKGCKDIPEAVEKLEELLPKN